MKIFIIFSLLFYSNFYFSIPNNILEYELGAEIENVECKTWEYYQSGLTQSYRCFTKRNNNEAIEFISDPYTKKIGKINRHILINSLDIDLLIAKMIENYGKPKKVSTDITDVNEFKILVWGEARVIFIDDVDFQISTKKNKGLSLSFSSCERLSFGSNCKKFFDVNGQSSKIIATLALTDAIVYKNNLQSIEAKKNIGSSSEYLNNNSRKDFKIDF
ncbi:MAG: hypothetical protein CMQ76_02555 [Gammaproteobacteria bacterium]|nr:hypothetical protein [Gammaproteobacteria bacterium]|tara:strand:- start:1182 stop:1832 length:651 start_codon:yes stop_codon:yes gene_type:complete